MTKADLINIVRVSTSCTKVKALQTVNKIFSSLSESLGKGERTTIVGFGSFMTRRRLEKHGRNPQTKARLLIPETVVPVFRAGKLLKEMVAKKK